MNSVGSPLAQINRKYSKVKAPIVWDVCASRRVFLLLESFARYEVQNGGQVVREKQTQGIRDGSQVLYHSLLAR